MRESILVEVRIDTVLTRLGSENSLQMCGIVSGILKSITSIIMKEFCVLIRKHLKPFVILKLI